MHYILKLSVSDSSRLWWQHHILSYKLQVAIPNHCLLCIPSLLLSKFVWWWDGYNVHRSTQVMQLAYLWYSAIKERALAKHKSSVAHAASQGPSHVSEVSSSNIIRKTGSHTAGKKWKTVYSKYRGAEARLQAYQTKEMPSLERNANTATSSNLHATAVVTFPGFANLGTNKDQPFNKHSSNNIVNTPIVPLETDNELMKKEHDARSGYLMPDEELLQKWTNSSWLFAFGKQIMLPW